MLLELRHGLLEQGVRLCFAGLARFGENHRAIQRRQRHVASRPLRIVLAERAEGLLPLPQVDETADRLDRATAGLGGRMRGGAGCAFQLGTRPIVKRCEIAGKLFPGHAFEQIERIGGVRPRATGFVRLTEQVDGRDLKIERAGAVAQQAGQLFGKFHHPAADLEGLDRECRAFIGLSGADRVLAGRESLSKRLGQVWNVVPRQAILPFGQVESDHDAVALANLDRLRRRLLSAGCARRGS